MSWKNKMKHVLQYKESCVISKISNLADNSSKLWKHLWINYLLTISKKLPTIIIIYLLVSYLHNQGLHSNINSHFPDIPDIILAFFTHNSWYFLQIFSTFAYFIYYRKSLEFATHKKSTKIMRGFKNYISKHNENT